MSAAQRIEEDENVPANPSPTPAHTLPICKSCEGSGIHRSMLSSEWCWHCGGTGKAEMRYANSSPSAGDLAPSYTCLNPAAYKECVEALEQMKATIETRYPSLVTRGVAENLSEDQALAYDAARAALTRAQGAS